MSMKVKGHQGTGDAETENGWDKADKKRNLNDFTAGIDIDLHLNNVNAGVGSFLRSSLILKLYLVALGFTIDISGYKIGFWIYY